MELLYILIIYLFVGIVFTSLFTSRVDIWSVIVWPMLLIGFVAFLIYDRDTKYIDDKEDNSWKE